MTTDNKPHYRVPCVTVDTDVTLDEFDDADIAGYLRQRGYFVSGTSAAPHDQDDEPANVLDPDALDHIDTLALCGQIEAARTEALALVGKAIGRTL